ncbi:MAG: hypothetical protein IT369_12320 [Candidatus Latescibacteria bacterium]|nr:hypothetical protein [Candidatus Latescibacterota bacterium]
MIRLSELGCETERVWVKVEGTLTRDTLPILAQSLADQQQRGMREVLLMADGVVSIDRLALEAWLRETPPQVEFCFVTSRVVLHQLLTSCGVRVVST